MKELIAKRYAKALMESVKEKELNSVIKELDAIDGIFAQSEVARIISSPLLPGRKKFDMFIAPIKNKISKNLFRLLEIMSEKNRLDLIGDLKQIMEFEAKRRSNRFEGTVAADKKLSDDEIANLENVLNDYSGSRIELKQVDKGFDGLRVMVSDIGLELSFSKARVKSDLLDYIQKAL